MLLGKKIVCVIPARLHSTRFPKKLLAMLSGKPLIQWTWEAALRVPFFDEVVIAVDDEELQKTIISFGGTCHVTSIHCLSGTERLVELHQNRVLQGDVFVNWQGDEPFISRKAVEDLLQTCQDSTVDIWTLKTPLSEDRAGDPNICKVVCSQEGKALYFSRSPIPFSREGGKGRRFFKHIGLYAYANHALQTMPSLSPCMLEEAEMLEQLRFLFHGLHVQVHETQEETLGIDLPEHLTEAETWMKQGKLLV